MAVDTLNDRRGYVKKGSGFGGTLALVLGIGVVVAGAGVAGLQYAMSHGWDQPSTTGQGPADPPTTSINLEHLEGVGSQTETTSATLPVVVAEPADSAAAPAEAPPTKAKQPYIPPSHTRHKSTDDTAKPAAGDPFGTTQ